MRDPAIAEAIAAAHGERVVASVDARAGKVAAEGWTEASELGTAEVIRELDPARAEALRLHARRGRRA